MKNIKTLNSAALLQKMSNPTKSTSKEKQLLENEFYLRFNDGLYRSLKKYLSRDARADELAEEISCRVMTKIMQLPNYSKKILPELDGLSENESTSIIAAFLFKKGREMSKAYQRMKKKEIKIVDADIDFDQFPFFEDETETISIEDEQKRSALEEKALYNVHNLLNTREKYLIKNWMYHKQANNYFPRGEVAKMCLKLGVNPNVLRVLMGRAIKKLRRFGEDGLSTEAG